MKTLSLKLEKQIFEEAEKITAGLNIARNRYINEAVDLFNRFHKRKLLKEQLQKESAMVASNSMDVLAELEQLVDED